jgi:hypothetical protein
MIRAMCLYFLFRITPGLIVASRHRQNQECGILRRRSRFSILVVQYYCLAFIHRRLNLFKRDDSPARSYIPNSLDLASVQSDLE